MNKCEKCGFWNTNKQCCSLENYELSEYCPALYENDYITYAGL